MGIDWHADGARLVTSAGAHVLDVRILIGPQTAATVASAVGVLRARAPLAIGHIGLVVRTGAAGDEAAVLALADTPPLANAALQAIHPGTALAAGVLDGEDGLVLQVGTPVSWAGAWRHGAPVLGVLADHLPVDPLGTYCTCGERGCLRTTAAAGELIRRLAAFRDPGLDLAGGLQLEFDVAHRDRGAEVILQQLAAACKTALRALLVWTGPLPQWLAVPRTLDGARLAASLAALTPIHQRGPLPQVFVCTDDTLALGAARAAASAATTRRGRSGVVRAAQRSGPQQ